MVDPLFFCIFFLFLDVQAGADTSGCFHLLEVTQSRGIGGIYVSRFFQELSGFLILLPFQVEQGKQVVRLDQLWILCQHFFQLDNSHVLVILPAVKQGLVVFPDRLVDGIQLVFVRLKSCNIQVCRIVRYVHVLADHPFAERCHHFARLKIHQPQQVSGCNIFFIKFQAPFQADNGSGQIPHRSLLQSFVVQKVRNPDDPFLQSNIRTTSGTVINTGKRCSTVYTIHKFPLFFFFSSLINSFKMSVTSVKSRL